MESSINTKLRKFFSIYSLKTYKKGDIICSPQKKCKKIGFIKSGFVRLYTKPRNSKEVTNINIAKPVFTMTMVSALSDKPQNYYLQALTPCEIWFAPRKDVLNFIKKNHRINQAITRYLTTSLSDFLHHLSLLKTGNAPQKVAATLQIMAENYGKKASSGKIIVEYPSTHRIIASVIGLTRETVSLQMSKFQKKHLITAKRSHFIINKPKELARLAE